MDRLLVVFGLFVMAFAAYSGQKDDAVADICPDPYPIICTVPFAAVYAYRNQLFETAVELQGFLVRAREQDAADSGTLLLFASSEHALACTTRFAVEIVPPSAVMAQELESQQGRFIRFWGWFKPAGDKRHWGKLALMRWYSTTGSNVLTPSCVALPAPSTRTGTGTSP